MTAGLKRFEAAENQDVIRSYGHAAVVFHHI